MNDRPRLLLIVAQSGRFLAQAAVREGFTVRVADCFADVDTLAISEQYLKLPALDQLTPSHWLQAVITLSAHQYCVLICGTGIERFYSQLAQLPAYIQFAGPTLTSFSTICDPRLWTSLLRELELPHPPTHFKQPQTEAEKWLTKQTASWGGTHITAAGTMKISATHYYQQRISGRSASVLFLANGHTARVLLFNEQFPRDIARNDFSLQGILNYLELTSAQQAFLHNALQQLTQRLTLQGLMSLDFIIDDDATIWLLEINPRPTASCQLLDDVFPIVNWHLAAVAGVLPQTFCELSLQKRLLWFCFSPENIVIPAAFNWPEYCYDLPADGHLVRQGDVICSLLISVTAGIQPNRNNGHQYANKLVQNLRQSA